MTSPAVFVVTKADIFNNISRHFQLSGSGQYCVVWTRHKSNNLWILLLLGLFFQLCLWCQHQILLTTETEAVRKCAAKPKLGAKKGQKDQKSCRDADDLFMNITITFHNTVLWQNVNKWSFKKIITYIMTLPPPSVLVELSGSKSWGISFYSHRIIIVHIWWELHRTDWAVRTETSCQHKTVGVSLKRWFKSCNRKHMHHNLFCYLLVR